MRRFFEGILDGFIPQPACKMKVAAVHFEGADSSQNVFLFHWIAFPKSLISGL